MLPIHRVLRFVPLSLLPLLVGCTSLQSVSVTQIPSDRSRQVRAEVTNTALLGIHFDNDFLDDLTPGARKRTFIELELAARQDPELILRALHNSNQRARTVAHHNASCCVNRLSCHASRPTNDSFSKIAVEHAVKYVRSGPACGQLVRNLCPACHNSVVRCI